MKKYFIILFIVFAFVLINCTKEAPKNSSQISKVKLKLNQESLTKFKDSLIGPKFIESLKIIGDGKVELIIADDNVVPANSYSPGVLECLNPALLFYNFPDLSIIQIKTKQWYGIKTGTLNRQELEKCLEMNFNEPNDSMFMNKINFGSKSYDCSESLLTDIFKDEESENRYLGLGKYAKKVEKEEIITTEEKKITYSDYIKIKNGMSLYEVEDILGKKGTLVTEAGDGDYKVETYQWIIGDYGENISICFIGDKVKSKVQIGLK